MVFQRAGNQTGRSNSGGAIYRCPVAVELLMPNNRFGGRASGNHSLSSCCRRHACLSGVAEFVKKAQREVRTSGDNVTNEDSIAVF